MSGFKYCIPIVVIRIDDLFVYFAPIHPDIDIKDKDSKWEGYKTIEDNTINLFNRYKEEYSSRLNHLGNVNIVGFKTIKRISETIIDTYESLIYTRDSINYKIGIDYENHNLENGKARIITYSDRKLSNINLYIFKNKDKSLSIYVKEEDLVNKLVRLDYPFIKLEDKSHENLIDLLHSSNINLIKKKESGLKSIFKFVPFCNTLLYETSKSNRYNYSLKERIIGEIVITNSKTKVIFSHKVIQEIYKDFDTDYLIHSSQSLLLKDWEVIDYINHSYPYDKSNYFLGYEHISKSNNFVIVNPEEPDKSKYLYRRIIDE
jgi:hypothetical protein